MPELPPVPSMAGRVALVTGAASNIGRATAQAVAAAGGRVLVTDLDRPGLTTTAERIRATSGDPAVALMEADLARPEAAAELVDAAVAAHGRLDVVVHAAVDHGRGNVEDQTPEQWHRAVAVNVGAAAWLIGAALPHLEATRGAVVLFSSVQARTGIPGCSLYGATKAAIEGLTRHLAVELGPRGIRVNAISPGFVTPEPAPYPEGRRAYPLARYGTADEIAAAVVFLASDAASWMTGSIVPIDGGVAATNPEYSAGWVPPDSPGRWVQRVRRFGGRRRP